MKRTNSRIVFLLTLSSLAIFSLFASTAIAQEDDAEKTTEKSLYERLGGVYSIASVVDDLIERLLVNDILNANPLINEARTRVPKAGLKYRLTSLMCQLAGGPEEYHGRNMKDSHAHLNITENEWDAMVAEFVTTLNHFKVPEKEQGELLALVAPTKGDIVTATPESD